MEHDPRNRKLAEVFVNYSLSIKRGDKVVISTSDLTPIDLIRHCYQLSLQKGAQVYLDIMGWNYLTNRSSFGGLSKIYYEEAKGKQIDEVPHIFEDILKWGDKFIRITTLDDYDHLSEVDPKLLMRRSKAFSDIFQKLVAKEWMLTYYPTEDMASRVGMTLEELFDFYFDAVLVDYKDMEKRGSKVKKLLDKAEEVRIIGEKTDLLINIKGRYGAAASGHRNIPDGEVFYAPVHQKTEGYIYYDMPFAKSGNIMNGMYLEFKNGKVVKASAKEGEADLLAGLDVDKGARYLGELGIGLNYSIDRVMKNTIFDEKLGGTVHVTLGMAYPYKEGGNPGKDKNDSAIHWDLVKDMRKPGSTIEVDGEVKFKDGEWLV